MSTALERENAREYQKLVRNIDRIANELEVVKDNDLGLLDDGTIRRLGVGAEHLRRLACELMQDPMWTGPTG